MFHCMVLDCGLLPDPVNGQVVLDGTTPGSIARYSCSQLKFHLVGEAVRVCGPDGEWSGVAPTCEMICQIIYLP